MHSCTHTLVHPYTYALLHSYTHTPIHSYTCVAAALEAEEDDASTAPADGDGGGDGDGGDAADEEASKPIKAVLGNFNAMAIPKTRHVRMYIIYFFVM